jgi:hypothetical protein
MCRRLPSTTYCSAGLAAGLPPTRQLADADLLVFSHKHTSCAPPPPLQNSDWPSCSVQVQAVLLAALDRNCFATVRDTHTTRQTQSTRWGEDADDGKAYSGSEQLLVPSRSPAGPRLEAASEMPSRGLVAVATVADPKTVPLVCGMR